MNKTRRKKELEAIIAEMGDGLNKASEDGEYWYVVKSASHHKDNLWHAVLGRRYRVPKKPYPAHGYCDVIEWM